jgi:hypothetical protein
MVFAAGLVLVLLSVALVFDSAWASLVVFASLPVSIAGVGAIFWATGTSFGREAAVGLILVIGLAVNQTILLVDAALERRRADGQTGGRADGRTGGRSGRRRIGAREVISSANDRAGMIVLVTLVTLASLFPLAIGTDPTACSASISAGHARGTVLGTVGALWVVPALPSREQRVGSEGQAEVDSCPRLHSPLLSDISFIMRLAPLLLALSLLTPHSSPGQWVVRPSPSAELWYHAMALTGPQGFGALPLYEPACRGGAGRAGESAGWGRRRWSGRRRIPPGVRGRQRLRDAPSAAHRGVASPDQLLGEVVPRSLYPPPGARPARDPRPVRVLGAHRDGACGDERALRGGAMPAALAAIEAGGRRSPRPSGPTWLATG